MALIRPTSGNRREFLKAVPAAAAALMPGLGKTSLSSMPIEEPPAFQRITADNFDNSLAALRRVPGTTELLTAKSLPMAMNLTVEEGKAAAEFEYHAHRDHIFQILEGSTRYELGGTPTEPRQTRPGEWLAKGSPGFQSVVIKKGDILMIPRMTPHRRVTANKVAFILVNVIDAGDTAG